MSTKNDGPAFPVQNCAEWQYHGMTLRDYFAAKAMAALVEDVNDRHSDEQIRDIPRTAYKMADAMLEARKS